MFKPAITGTGVFTPNETITNAELVDAFNAYADTFNAENPFDEKDLLLKDIFKASQELSQSKRRIRVHHRPGELREAALNSPDAWNRLVATSKWKAEELRAANQHRPFNQEDAFSNYEKDCWVWSISDRIQIGVMWS